MKTECLTDEVMADYLEGRLSDQERFLMEQHVSSCAACLERLVVTSQVLKKGCEPATRNVPGEVTDRAVEMVLGRPRVQHRGPVGILHEKLETLSAKVNEVFSFRPWGEAVYQPVRAVEGRIDKDQILIRKKIGDLNVEIEIGRKEANKCDIRVVVPPEERAGRRLRTTLMHDDREIASQLIENDVAVFEEILFGRYRLLINDRDYSIGNYAFEVTESGCGER